MEQIIGLIVQYALDISAVTVKYSQKLHDKCVDLSLYAMIKTLIENGNQQNTNTVTIAMDI